MDGTFSGRLFVDFLVPLYSWLVSVTQFCDSLLQRFPSQYMSTIYQGRCPCGYRSKMTGFGFSAVIVEDLSTIPDSCLHPDDKRVAILFKPGEDESLKRYGFTGTSATLAGRILVYREHFCDNCGHLYESRKLGADKLVFGCLPQIIAAVSIGFAFGLYESSIFLGIGAALMAIVPAVFLAYWMSGMFVRLFYYDRARKFRIDRRCPKCGSSRIRKTKASTCPKCRQRTMEVKTVGMS
jgi:uncharacterized OB-fold protein